MDFPATTGLHLPVVSSTSFEAFAGSVRPTSANAAVGLAWPAANHTIYIPFELRSTYMVRKLAWSNGATVNGNVDMGVLTRSGALLVSTGSTAQANTNALQSADVTDTLLYPGIHYWGLSLSSATGTMFRIAAGLQYIIAAGCAQEATFPLPTQATFATVANDYYPICGMTNRTLI